jgi:hypothetical protein
VHLLVPYITETHQLWEGGALRGERRTEDDPAVPDDEHRECRERGYVPRGDLECLARTAEDCLWCPHEVRDEIGCPRKGQ